jgi:hypothetical protein
MRIPTAAQYKKAFLAIRPKMHAKHLEMLRAHHAAPGHTISVKALGKAVGYKQAQGAYGRLGRFLCDELGFEPTMMEHGKPVLTQVLADAPGERHDASWEWTLWPQVVQALSDLGWVDNAESANAYVLTWNPKQWPWDEKEYAKEVKATAAGKLFPSRWSCGNTKRIRPGDRLFLMRQGTNRGLIGSGFATSEAFPDAHWDESRDDTANYIEFQGDALVQMEDRMPVERLLHEDLAVPWNNLYASGVQVPAESVCRLERLWTAHLLKLGRSVSADSADATDDQPSLSEGEEVDRVLRAIIQRRGQPAFRERLMAAYKGECAVTGCDASAALEAAHIRPYSGASSCEVTNGLLLRADIHTLFDLNLLGIEPSSLKVALAPELRRTCFKELNGKKLTVPIDTRLQPSKDALREKWKQFQGEA